MSVEQFVLPAAVVEIAVVDLAVLVDVVVQGQLHLAERLPIDHDIVRLKSHTALHQRGL